MKSKAAINFAKKLSSTLKKFPFVHAGALLFTLSCAHIGSATTTITSLQDWKDYVRLGYGDYVLGADIALPLSSSWYGVSISSGSVLTLAGNEYYLKQDKSDSSSVVFKIYSGGEFSLSNIVVDGFDCYVIYNEGTVSSVDNVIFQNHNTPVVTYGNYGAVIYNTGTINSIANSYFDSNSVSSGYYGGAIANMANSTISTISICSFTDNEAGSGGAIINRGNIMSIQGTIFTQNVATNQGGAVYNSGTGTITTISGTNFVENKANFGGAIMNWGTITRIQDTNFSDNSATTSGGAIYNSGTFTYYAMHSNNVISGNSASYGGFLYAASGSSATFNIAKGATLTIGAADLQNNTDDSIYTKSTSTFTKTGAGTMLVRSNFDNNGAIIINDGIMIIEGDVEQEDDGTYWFANADLSAYLSDTADSTTLMLGTSLNVGDGLYVGTSAPEDIQTNSTNTASFASNSVLVVHADGTSSQNTYDSTIEQAALIGDGSSTLTVGNGAELIVYGGSVNTEIRIAQGFVDEDTTVTGVEVDKDMWSTVTHVNPLYTLERAYWRQEETSETAIALMALEENGVEITPENVTDNYYLYFSVDMEALGDLAQLASIAGVASNTASIATSAMDASGARFAIPDYDPELTRGFNLWAIPIFSMVYGDDFASTRDGANKTSSYNTTYGGLNIGADYTTHKDYRFGIGLHAGYGETASNGDYEHTENDFSFWGVTLYGGRMWNDFSIYADVNVSMTKSDLVQNNPKFASAQLSAETDAYAFTAEVRADYRIRTDYVDILPHVGARYMNVDIDSYDVKQLGDTICSVETLDQNIWSFPVGVQFSHEWTFGEENTPDYAYEHGHISQEEYYALAEQDDVHTWTLKPRLDLGVIFATGDIDADSTAYMPDRSVSQNMTMQTFDRFAYSGNLGVDLRHGQSTFSLDYATRISEHLSVQDIFFTWRYEF